MYQGLDTKPEWNAYYVEAGDLSPEVRPVEALGGLSSCLEVSMSLADALSSPPPARPRRCAVGRVLDGLSDQDHDALASALFNADFSTTAIQIALREEGHAMARSTVVIHRRGECACVAV